LIAASNSSTEVCASALRSHWVFVAVAERCGSDRGQSWTGGSIICDVSGYLSAEAATGKPDVLWATIEPAAADDKRLGSVQRRVR
jgi:predicted amidohydrolase